VEIQSGITTKKKPSDFTQFEAIVCTTLGASMFCGAVAGLAAGIAFQTAVAGVWGAVGGVTIGGTFSMAARNAFIPRITPLDLPLDERGSDMLRCIRRGIVIGFAFTAICIIPLIAILSVIAAVGIAVIATIHGGFSDGLLFGVGAIRESAWIVGLVTTATVLVTFLSILLLGRWSASGTAEMCANIMKNECVEIETAGDKSVDIKPNDR